MKMDKKRVIIESIEPEIDGGKFPAKAILGDKAMVEADIFIDGNELIHAELLHRKKGEKSWLRAEMIPLVNDRWRAGFLVDKLGKYEFSFEAWIDHFQTWLRDFIKKIDAGIDIEADILVCAQMIKEAAEQARGTAKQQLQGFFDIVGNEKLALEKRIDGAMNPDLTDLMMLYPIRKNPTKYDKILEIEVDRKTAEFSSWYELFPRSAALDGKTHGTFKDVVKLLPYISGMGFDVLYLPPIHPIGTTKRKGKNNALKAGKGDPGSPWAIGNKEGGHKAIHPELGTLDDFKDLVVQAKKQNIEIALDIAFQCSPDHPYVKDHPEWFKKRPDGSIQYAENPPKKYEDIFPFDFECDDWQALWEELKSIFEYWIEQGVTIFRVDNPHTKPFRFWEYVISEIKREHREVIFLAEAFTRPKVMDQLGKLGFSQSYTYFSWRNSSWELKQYLYELTKTGRKYFFRPNFWPNTPDILTELLQSGGRPAFLIRHALAATLSSNYGIYGPAFELVENSAREFGSEEYLDSEKYQLRKWNLKEAYSLKDYISRINNIRSENSALQSMENLIFHHTDNEQLIAFSKQSADRGNLILVVINLDPYHTHSGWLDLSLDKLGIDWNESFQVFDLLSDSWYIWNGARNYVELNPHISPAHIFKVRKKVRTEEDFDYYL